jgi:hypothetical protein
VVATRPTLVAWTDHAALRAQQLTINQTDAEAALLEGHDQRRANPGAGDWMTTGRGIAVVYDWPVEDDPLTARLVTLWRAR